MKAALHDIDIKLLRVFRAVARHQGFTAAQEELCSTQSAISMNMATLEARLGVRLCERGVKGFQLTQQGKDVLEQLDILFAAIDAFRVETERLKGIVTGTLTIGIVDNISGCQQFNLPFAINKLKLRFPQLGVDLFVGAPAQLEERLLDGRIRAAVGLFHRHNQKLNYHKLFAEEHQLYCGQQHPFFTMEDDNITDRDLLNALYVGRDYLEGYTPLRPPIPFTPVASSPYVEGLANLILSGCYIAYLPTHYAQSFVASEVMKSIKHDFFRRFADISLAYRKAKSIPSELRYLIGLMSSN